MSSIFLRRSHPLSCFVVHKVSQIVTARKTGDELVFVLEDTTNQISGDTDVKHVMSGAVCHDVNEKAFWFAHGRYRRTPDPSLRLKNGCAQDDAFILSDAEFCVCDG